ncbi:MAG: hypothetical protein JWP36_2448 [Paucimonas sp.]|nr:hypothetical protein [Paucimonas sp.]
MSARPGAVRRATRWLLALQALAVIALLALAMHFLPVPNAWLALVMSLGSVLLLRMLIIGNNFLLAWLYRSPTPAPHRLHYLQAPAMFLREYASSMASSSWTMAFFSFDKRVFADSPALPVLLIHGYGCNSGYWHAMSRALSQARISHYAIDLEPVFGDIDSFVPAVQQAIEKVCAETGAAQVILVAHSMGGLVARAWLRVHGPARVKRIITLGTPHQGTGLANFGMGLNSRQMRWTGSAAAGRPSAWLQQLEAGEAAGSRALFVSIWSHQDNIVSPQESSRLAGARNIEVKGIGHVALAFSPLVQGMVIREILEASTSRHARLAEHD